MPSELARLYPLVTIEQLARWIARRSTKALATMVLAWGALFVWTGVVRAELAIPKYDQRCKDLAGVFSEDERRDLDDRLRAYKDASGNEIAILTIPSLEGQPIEDYAYRVFREWGLGDKKRDNGVLLVLALAERKLRFEVGKGLEGDLTDLQTDIIRREKMAPLTKRGQWYAGFVAGVDAIEHALSGQAYGSQPRPATAQPRDGLGWLLAILLVTVIVILLIRAARGGNGPGPGGGSGGGGVDPFVLGGLAGLASRDRNSWGGGGSGWDGGSSGGGWDPGPSGGGGESGGGGSTGDV